MPGVRILLLGDTHLGFDLPFHPRVDRRRRGDDFFANYKRALRPAFRGEVDAVVHGGDLLYRSKVPPALVQMAMEPLFDVADRSIPVVVVPGNHERAKIPYPLLAAHPNVHIFDHPRTVWLDCSGVRVGISGFPFCRAIRDRFSNLVRGTGFEEKPADVRLLCLHQAIEGATVGPVGFTFRQGIDVIRGQDLPGCFAAVLSGHIHLAQVLRTDLAGRRLAAPVVYPGSIERVSFAERNEDKGYVIVELCPSQRSGGQVVSTSFVRLPARPMVTIDLNGDNTGAARLSRQLKMALASVAEDSVVRVRVERLFSAERLRKLVPPSVNISMSSRMNLQP